MRYKLKSTYRYIRRNAGEKTIREMADYLEVPVHFVANYAKRNGVDLKLKRIAHSKTSDITGFDEIQRMAYCMAWR